MCKRVIDILFSGVGLIVFLIPMLILAAIVKLTSKGPVLYWSDRVGRHNELFKMPKFRTMIIGVPAVATHLLTEPDRYMTKFGPILRQTSLDELPQLWCILKGEMSIVGPRPALFNQHDLIGLRNQYGVEILRPGLTGWAQINGRDELLIPDKVALDVIYMKKKNNFFDLIIIIKTINKVIFRSSINH